MPFEASRSRSFPTTPTPGHSRGFANWLRTGVLLAGLTALFLVIGQAVGGTTGLLFAAVFAAVSNFVAYWFSDKLALAVHGAKELDRAQFPWIFATVEELARKAEMPMPRLYIIPSHTPNAFATGRSPEKAAVAVTTGILNVLDRRQLTGVLAHELAHVKNRDTLIATIAATFAGAITSIAHMLSFAAMFGGVSRSEDEEGGGGLISSLALIILAPLAATVIQLAISRSREYGADATGAALCGDPHALADALEALERGAQAIPDDRHPATASLMVVNPLSGRSVMGLFSTHPPTDERVRRLRAMSRGF